MSQKQQAADRRDTLLLSHANPEDNEFTLWLALQLANEGFKVWSDLTELLAGEVFWDNIEEAIRSTAVKVLFVLSRSSNAKDGPLRELQLAQTVARKQRLKDFVIPLHIDDLEYEDMTIEVTRINALPFERSWSEGLAKLLEKLEKDGVPKDPRFSRTAVNDWWRSKFSAEKGVRLEPEDYLSNWFPITGLPSQVYFHVLGRRSIGKIEVPSTLPYPAVQDGISLITFAEAQDFDGKLGPDHYIAQASEPRQVDELLTKTDFGKHLFRLLRLAWEQMLAERDLPTYELANGAKCFYFPKDKVTNDTVFFTGVDGARTHRAMVGFSTRTNPTTGVAVKRYWHFAVQARPFVHPTLALIFKSHVLFTSDGVSVWQSKKRLASARRSQCRSWWNDEWRDRTLAVAAYLCDGGPQIQMTLGSAATLSVSPTPLVFRSPVAYTDPQLLGSAGAEEPPDDYGRESQEEDDFEDAPDTVPE